MLTSSFTLQLKLASCQTMASPSRIPAALSEIDVSLSGIFSNEAAGSRKRWIASA
jgi:hypothetical protein